MTWDKVVEVITLVEFIAGLAACMIFVPLFHIRSHGLWRKTSLGRNLMILMVLMGLIMTLSVARTFWGDYRYREEILMGLFGVYSFVLWQRVFLLEHMSRETRRAAATSPASAGAESLKGGNPGATGT